jgi:hypothetical protein
VGNAEKFKDALKNDHRDVHSPFVSTEMNAANSFRDEVIGSKAPESNFTSTVSRGYTVLKDMAYGAADEIVNHPGTLLNDAVIGAGLAGMSKFDPKIALGASVAVTGVGAVSAYQFSGDIWQAMKTATDPGSLDSQAKFEAEQHLERLGAKSIQAAAVIVGGLIAHKWLGRSKINAGGAALDEVSAQSLKNARAPQISDLPDFDESVLGTPRFRRTAGGVIESTPKMPRIHDRAEFGKSTD